MSHQNFQGVPVDGPAQELKADSMQTDYSGAPDKGSIYLLNNFSWSCAV